MARIPVTGLFPSRNNHLLSAREDIGGGMFPVSDNAFTLASTFLITTLIVQIIAILIFFARVYTRTFPVWRCTADDYLIAISFVLMNVMFGLQYASEMWAWGGRHPQFMDIDEVTHVAMIGTISLPFWAWATGFVKISIGVMLLRFQQSRGWRIFLYFMIALNVVLVLFTGIGNLFQCIPYRATWDFKGEVKNKKCWGKEMAEASNYISALCNVGSDVVFSLMPLTFLGKIRRPLRERVVIGGLMALGLVASSFSMSRAIVTGKVGKSKDGMASVILVGLLSCLEVQCAFIAACIPTLRSSSKRLLTRIGLLNASRSSGYPRYGAGSSISGGPKGARRGQMELNHIESGGTVEIMEIVQTNRSDSRELEEDQLEVDPVTGRIKRVDRLNTNASRSNFSARSQQQEGSSGRRSSDEIEVQPRIGMAA